MSGNEAAKPEYAAAKIAVWWDMKDCPIPKGYDARRIRPSLEEAFKKLGYSGPVSITAYSDQKQNPDRLLRVLSSTGVAVAHTITQNTCSKMYSDMLEWRRHNPPPATMMLISDQAEKVLRWDLARLQQWVWESLLGSTDQTTSAALVFSEVPAMFYCKSCSFDCQSLASFRRHLSSSKHVVEEIANCGNGELDPVTRLWGRNYPAKPEHATAQIAVWWDMEDCPIPEGYDARRVPPSLEGEFKKLGYSGPVSITAFGNLKQTPDHLLRELSSTGVVVVHTILENLRSVMFSDLIWWVPDNPPPATMMLISNHVEEDLANYLVRSQQRHRYNFFLAYSLRPYKMSILVTSAEWMWDSLLAVSETRRQVSEWEGLQRCTSSEKGESTRVFDCDSCYYECKGLDDFRKHLNSEDHKAEEARIYSSFRLNKRNREEHIKEQNCPKSKRLRKAPRSGFDLFFIIIYVSELENLKLARKNGVTEVILKISTCKKEWCY